MQTNAVLSAESVTRGHPTASYFWHHFESLRDVLKQAIRTACHLQVSCESDVNNAIIAVMDSSHVQWLFDPDAVDMPASVELSINALLEDLRNRKSAASSHNAS